MVCGTVGTSTIDPLACGLVSVFTYKYQIANHTKTKNQVRKKNFKGKFSNRNSKKTVFDAHCFNISYTTFRNKYFTIIQIYGIEKQKKFRNKESFAGSLFRKKRILLSDNTKSQHQILNCNSYFKSPVKIELASCPIRKANLKKKKKMQVYSMKNILHEVINKTLAYINSLFKKYNTLFTKPVKKII